MRWKDLGSVAYGFLVQVGPQGATPIPLSTSLSADMETPLPPVSIPVLSPALRIGKGMLSSLALSPDGRWLAVNTLLGIYQYHVDTFAQAWFYPVQAKVLSLVFSPDSKTLALGGIDGGIQLLDAGTGTARQHMQTQENTHLAWSPDGLHLVSGASCETVTIWDAQNGNKVKEFRGDQCSEGYSGTDVAWSEDGQRIFAARAGRILLAWNTRTYQPVAGWQAANLPYAMVASLLAAPVGASLAEWDSLGGTTVTLLDGSASGKVLHILDGQVNGPVVSVAWSPDGRWLAIGYGMDTGITLVWDATTGAVVDTLKGFYPCEGMAWLPDGQVSGGIGRPGWQRCRGENKER